MDNSRFMKYQLRRAFLRQYLLQKIVREKWMRMRSEEREYKIKKVTHGSSIRITLTETYKEANPD